MLTSTDIKKLENVFVTRDDFQVAVSRLVTKDEFITRLDAVMFELKAIREELAVIVYRQCEHTDLLENHDQRLAQLEKPSH